MQVVLEDQSGEPLGNLDVGNPSEEPQYVCWKDGSTQRVFKLNTPGSETGYGRYREQLPLYSAPNNSQLLPYQEAP